MSDFVLSPLMLLAGVPVGIWLTRSGRSSTRAWVGAVVLEVTVVLALSWASWPRPARDAVNVRPPITAPGGRTCAAGGEAPPPFADPARDNPPTGRGRRVVGLFTSPVGSLTTHPPALVHASLTTSSPGDVVVHQPDAGPPLEAPAGGPASTPIAMIRPYVLRARAIAARATTARRGSAPTLLRAAA